MMALILPVIPATGLKRSVLAAAGIGTGAGGAGGVTVAGGSLLTGTVAKVAAVTVLAGGARRGHQGGRGPQTGRPRGGPTRPASPARSHAGGCHTGGRGARPAGGPARHHPQVNKAKARAEARRRSAARTPAGERRRSRGNSRKQPRRRAPRPGPSAGGGPGPDGAAGEPVVPPGQIRKQQTPAAAPEPRRGTAKAKPEIAPKPAKPQKQKPPKP